MIQETVEARWFFGPSDARVRKIGALFVACQSEPERRDRYVSAGRDDVGIKLRDDVTRGLLLETKIRLGAIGPVAVAPNIVCHCEHWTKRSFVVEPGAAERGDDSISIGKARRRRFYAVGSQGAREVEGEPRRERGCSVEWTALSRDRNLIAWTLGLESFGASASELLQGLLSTAASFFSSAAPGLAICASSSMGYPAWSRAWRAGEPQQATSTCRARSSCGRRR